MRDEMVNFELVTSDGGPSQLKSLWGLKKQRQLWCVVCFYGCFFVIDHSLNE